MKKIVLSAALALLAMTSVAGAHERSGYNSQREIDARQSNQEARIQQGVRSGDLTRREAAALEAEQAHIRALERNAQRDGRIDRREAAQIRQAQEEASRHIYQERHDNERRGDGWRNRRWW